MRSLLKKALIHLPRNAKRVLVRIYESYFYTKALRAERKEYDLPAIATTGNRKNILIYHISGLSFGGTEKNLQSIANSLCEEYNIYFMYSDANGGGSRASVLDKGVILLPFTYKNREASRPGFIHGMNPHIKTMIGTHKIDLIITAGSGYAEYPINTIRTIPVIMINVFGSPTLQQNILKNIFISRTVQDFSERYTGHVSTSEQLFIPVQEHVLRDDSIVKKITSLIGRSPQDFVFGRIGRNSDLIFDEIGIRAFQKVVAHFPHAKYLIMAPPPALQRIVKNERIPNVFFLEPSSDEDSIWSFHHSIDALAHFRYDGETQGLNICEAMYTGKPIISHISPIWNAQAEYLDSGFSRMAKMGDIDEYASYMKEFIKIKMNNPHVWENMQSAARDKARELFSLTAYKKSILRIVSEII